MRGADEDYIALSLSLFFPSLSYYPMMLITHSDPPTFLSALLSYWVDIVPDNGQYVKKYNSSFNGPVFSIFWQIISYTNFTQIKRLNTERSVCHRVGYDRLYRSSALMGMMDCINFYWNISYPIRMSATIVKCLY